MASLGHNELSASDAEMGWFSLLLAWQNMRDAVGLRYLNSDTSSLLCVAADALAPCFPTSTAAVVLT